MVVREGLQMESKDAKIIYYSIMIPLWEDDIRKEKECVPYTRENESEVRRLERKVKRARRIIGLDE